MNKKIIINFPTNIGDTVIGLPVLDRLKTNYPQGKITAITSPKTEVFLKQNTFIDHTIIFCKKWGIKQKILFALSLAGKYDIFVDLKNSFLPVISGAKIKTPFIRKFPKNTPAKDMYLNLIKKFTSQDAKTKSEFIITEEEKNKWHSRNFSPVIFIACSSLSSKKRYPYVHLKAVVQNLKQTYPLVILGEKADRTFYKDILSEEGVVDLVGKTSISDIFYLLKNYARLIICVDSSIMHIASYLNLPIVALFGPTSANNYGPWSDNYIILQNKTLSCCPCESSQCKINHECMNITLKEIKEAIEIIIKKINA